MRMCETAASAAIGFYLQWGKCVVSGLSGQRQICAALLPRPRPSPLLPIIIYVRTQLIILCLWKFRRRRLKNYVETVRGEIIQQNDPKYRKIYNHTEKTPFYLNNNITFSRNSTAYTSSCTAK